MTMKMRNWNGTAAVLAALALSTVLLRAQSGAVAVTPASASVLVGQTQSFTLSGGVIPTAVAAGAWHTCVTYSDASVRCVGKNSQGQLGNGTYANTADPTVVSDLANPVSLDAGNEHTCALIGDGTMRCWGTNYTGQLGDGTMGGFALVPQPVRGISNAISSFTGGFHTCAMLPDRTIQCWGRNQDGQLGNGDSTTDVPLPAPVQGIGAVAALATGGYHNCALMPDTTVRCWGRNTRGQVGNGTSDSPVTAPSAVAGLSNVASLALGGYHSCALMKDATVLCWGQSDFGQIGAPSLPFSSTPIQVAGIAGAVLVKTGFRHTCVALSDGTVRCWGHNDFGQLGDGTTTDSAAPVTVRGVANVRALAGGEGHTCALMADSAVLCWGEGDLGQLGNGASVNSTAPVKVNGTGVAWTSSNPSVATVDSTGRATARAPGTAVISASDPFGHTASATLVVRQMFTLAVLRQGDGTGQVTSAPGGIDCGSACAAQFVSDSQVTLTASPVVNSSFAGWTGCDSVSGLTCTVAMSSARSVGAVFMLKRFTLTVTRSGIGRGTVTSSPAGITCGTACASDFVIDTTVTLTAAPAPGSIFTGWSGCDATSGSTCTVRMSRARSVTAAFLGLPFP